MATNNSALSTTTREIEILDAQDDRLLFASAFSGHVYAKSLLPSGATEKQPVIAILTYPTEDYAGDRVKPDGGDWSQYPNHPYVNWSHRIPIGRGSVKHQVLKHDDQYSPVAVGQTTFLYTKADVEGLDLRRRDPRTHRSWDKEPPYTVDDVLRAAAQAERLIRDDIATGVSIEFDVNQLRRGQDWWDLNKMSLLENRPARHFEVWRGLGYAHARQPVNPGCLTVAGQPMTASVEKAITIAQTGKLPGGEPLCEIILKSFLDLKNYRSSATMVNVPAAPPPSTEDTTPNPATPNAEVVVKSVDTPTTTDLDTTSPSTGSEKMGAGHQALMDAAQALHDICERLDNNGSDDLSIRKYCKKMCSKLEDIAGDIKARAEKHKAKLDGAEKADTEDDDEDPMDEDDYEPSKEEKAIEVDAEGAIITKAFPNWKPRRMTFKDILPEAPAPAPVPSPQEVVEEPVITKAQRKATKLATNRLAKSLTGLNQLLDAALANGRL